MRTLIRRAAALFEPKPAEAPAEFERYVVSDPATLAEIERLYVETFFTDRDAEFLKTPAARKDIEANVSRRYNQSVRNLLPWIQRVADLRGKVVVEIGCGTGSSAAALARLAAHVHTCDVKERSLPTARGRFELLGLSNISVTLQGAPQFFDTLRAQGVAEAGAVVLPAVLEHQTIPERLQTLRAAWSMLSPGGVLIVYESPNRLTYMDRHTTDLPFFHMLQEDLAIRYAHRSPRGSFREPMRETIERSMPDARLFLIRHGVGVSYHEFELGLPRDGVAILADGYEAEMTALWGVNYEERLLQSFVLHEKLPIHPAFMRNTLCLILAKQPAASGWVSQTPARDIKPMS